MLFLSERSPPFITSHIMLFPSMLFTLNERRPLFTRIVSPMFTSEARSLYVTETWSWFPSQSSQVKVKVSPSSRCILCSLKVFILYSGPFVSSIIAIGRFSCSRTLTMVLIFACCSSCVPCEKFSLATFMPARHISLRMSSFSLAGPIVHMILVFRICHYLVISVYCLRKR